MNTIRQYKSKSLNFISISDNNFKVVLCDLGASLYEVYLDNKSMTVQSKDFDSHNIRFGKTMGRVAGRLPGSITINNKTYKLDNNEGVNTLHGGNDCIANQIFKVLNIENKNSLTTISYQYLSPDGQAGFPGNFLISVIYEIDTKDCSIRITFKVICDQDCPIDITNHSYFNLGDKNINNLKMLVKADRFIYPNGPDMMPLDTKPIIPCLDFNKYKFIKKDINDKAINYGVLNGYDHYFFFKKVDTKNPQMMLENDKYHLDVYTDFPGSQIYTDQPNYLGVTFETQNPTNDFNKILVRKNTQYKHWVKFAFSRI